MSIRHALFTLISTLVLACSAAQGTAAPQRPESAAPQQQDESGPPAGAMAPKRFVDAGSYLTSSAELDAWYGILIDLKDDFDAVCGDTFCEGDYSNYEPLRFRCSVEEHAGTIGTCVWVLAASNEDILPSTGEVEVDARIFRCVMPLAPETPVSDLIEALSTPGERAIHAALPGTGRSLYDGLADCL
ncbi:hypothetical protein WMF31_35315 [Sorangium sp. So ce1036]|uniref:hypothetical protein n=1 Tax=Sorangium sp. So ce1036 TaxID=3133328 RepID=UPI003F055AD1